MNTAEKKCLLDEARSLQHEFWDKLLELEGEMGIEIDSDTDLEDVTLDDLMKRGCYVGKM